MDAAEMKSRDDYFLNPDYQPTITERIVPLSDADKFEYGLELGYIVKSSEGIECSIDEGDFSLTYRVVELWKDQNLVYSSKDVTNKSDKVGCEKETPGQIYPYIEAALKEHEEPNKVEWIRRNFAPTYSEIPPYNRYDKKHPENNRPTRLNLELKAIENIVYIDNAAFSDNDTANAVRFDEECSDFLVFDENSQKWYAYVTNHWEEAKTNLGKSAAYVANSIQAEYKYVDDEYSTAAINKDTHEEYKILYEKLKAARTALYSNAKSAANKRNMQAMIDIAASTTMAVDFNEVSDTKYIACKNGILNTKTGEFIYNWDIEKIDEIKKSYPVNYVDCTYFKDKISKLWINHLKKVCYDNTTPEITDEVREERMHNLGYYLRCQIAYLLYPGNPKRKFIFWWGKGKNGKSVTVLVLKEIFTGLYSDPNIQELYVSKEDRPRSSISDGLSKRIAFFDEAEDDENEYRGGRVCVALVKSLTGDGKTPKFRGMREKAKSETVICTPIGITNELPHFDKDLDQAMLDRIDPVPWLHRFTDDEIIDDFDKKLIEEKDLIFSMIVDDYIKHMKIGIFELPTAPDFIQLEQKRLLSGFPYADYVESQLIKEENGRVSRQELEHHFISWLDKNHLDEIKLRWKDTGNNSGRFELFEKDRKRLFKTIRVYGFDDMMSTGKRFFVGCKLKASV